MNRRPLPPLCLLLLVCAAALLPSGCATRPKVDQARGPRQIEGTHVKVRPGIGTLASDTLVSWVEPATFSRAHANRPNFVGTVNYNDLDGVNATLDYLGGEARDVTGLWPAGDVHFSLRDQEGRWLKTWALKAWRFAIGEKGRRYEVFLKNISERPVEVVVTVDGWDALDGEVGRKSKRGYVLDAREEFSVKGFRLTDGTVAAFRFGDMPDTFAQRRHGDTRNVGVIGVAVFREGRGEAPKDEPQPIRPARPGEPRSSREYTKPLPEA